MKLPVVNPCEADGLRALMPGLTRSAGSDAAVQRLC